MSGIDKVYIIGSKGIPAKYGGFETFAERLIAGKSGGIEYVVTGMANWNESYEYLGAQCVQFKTKDSAFGRMTHMIRALSFVFKDSKKSQKSAVYILGCRAGIFLPFARPFLKSRNVEILVNPDGAEWKRSKWSPAAKFIVWFFEHLLVKASDKVVCDSIAILDIMRDEFHVKPEKLEFIAYGSDIYDLPVKLPVKIEKKYNDWMKSFDLLGNPYYLMVGRFVPENNFEMIIREFMLSKSTANLVIISNVSDGALKTRLTDELKIGTDSRIKLVGTLYDQDVLKVVRARATAYLHGHEVGGTNPSLLEALGSTNVNLIYGVSFNKEVAGDTGYYFNAEEGNLAALISETDKMTKAATKKLGVTAKARIVSHYSWDDIVVDYEALFNDLSKSPGLLRHEKRGN